jgi:hypothetical protein
MTKAEAVQLQAKGKQQMERPRCRHRNQKLVHSGGDVYVTATYYCLDCVNAILRIYRDHSTEPPLELGASPAPLSLSEY